jgi:hypothetical protein
LSGELEQLGLEEPEDLKALDGGDDDKTATEDDGLDAGEDNAEEADT